MPLQIFNDAEIDYSFKSKNNITIFCKQTLDRNFRYLPIYMENGNTYEIEMIDT